MNEVNKAVLIGGPIGIGGTAIAALLLNLQNPAALLALQAGGAAWTLLAIWGAFEIIIRRNDRHEERR